MLMAELHLEYSASSEMSRSFTNTLRLGIFRQSPGSGMGEEALLQLCSEAELGAGRGSGSPKRDRSHKRSTGLPDSPAAWLTPYVCLSSNRISTLSFVPKLRKSSNVI